MSDKIHYIVVINGREVYAFDTFNSAYAFLLAHEHAELFQLPNGNVGPCENLGK